MMKCAACWCRCSLAILFLHEMLHPVESWFFKPPRKKIFGLKNQKSKCPGRWRKRLLVQVIMTFRNSAVVSCCCRPSTAVVRAFASHQCSLGSIPAWCHMWVQLLRGFFPLSSSFPPLTKTNISKFQFDQDRGPT